MRETGRRKEKYVKLFILHATLELLNNINNQILKWIQILKGLIFVLDLIDPWKEEEEEEKEDHRTAEEGKASTQQEIITRHPLGVEGRPGSPSAPRRW